LDLDFETEIFAGDTQARTNAILHNVKSKSGREGLVALFLKMLDHIKDCEDRIYALENP